MIKDKPPNKLIKSLFLQNREGKLIYEKDERKGLFIFYHEGTLPSGYRYGGKIGIVRFYEKDGLIYWATRDKKYKDGRKTKKMKIPYIIDFPYDAWPEIEKVVSEMIKDRISPQAEDYGEAGEVVEKKLKEKDKLEEDLEKYL